MDEEELRLADLFAALSVATDLGMGQEPEKAIRSCLVATELARTLDLTDNQVRDVYYTTLLQHLGCTASAHELTAMFGDDVGVLPAAERTDDTSLRATLQVLGLAGRGTGLRRPQHLMRVLSAGKQGSDAIVRSTCEVGTRLAERLHLGDGVAAALQDSTETWDGHAGAYGRSGDDIALPARLSLLATQAVIFDRLGGPELAVEVVQERAGRLFDPELAATFARCGPALLGRLADADVWREVLEAEPRPIRCIPTSQLDRVARVFADMVDLKSSFMLGHSSEVAELAAGAAASLGLADEQRRRVRRAGLLHDLGRVAVSGSIWGRRSALTATQWEQVRLHPYHTERILGRSAALAELAPIAGRHHEREDGSGYHHGASGGTIPLEARLLAAADAFQALTSDRPHREGLPADRAVGVLESEAAEGRLHVECVRAVVEAAGHQPARVAEGWPAGLTDREVEVLRLLAAGDTNRRIAESLVISPRTAEHHVQHIYAKIGGSTRAAAALFAMENGLVR